MGDPIARVQNPYPNNIVEFVKNLPKKELSYDSFKQYMKNCKWGYDSFFKTYYQLCCQVGLYYIDDNNTYHPRFTKDITIEEATNYLKNWFSKYYVPNPYTRGFSQLAKPILVEQSIYEYLKSNVDNSIENVCKTIFKEEIGNPDIFMNAINSFSDIIKIENKRCFIKEGAKKMEVTNSRDDKKAFFENFNIDNNRAPKIDKAYNRIIFGAPGTGKSNRLAKEQKQYFPNDTTKSAVSNEEIIRNELLNIGNSYSKCFALGFTFSDFFKDKKPKYIRETYGCNADAAYITSQGERCKDFFNTLPDYKEEEITVEKIQEQLKKLETEKYLKEAGSAAVGRKYSSFLYGKSISEICDVLGLIETHTQSRFIWYGVQSVDYTFEEQKEEFIKYCERVTFHPNYSYAQFVGTYKPIQNPENPDEIRYEYVPGPFMRTYVNAVNHKGKNFLLLIEEINRANVAAVFGDVFQLLDRKSDGTSEYPITVSEDMKKYLAKNGIKDDEISIPSNMYLWATMNSADQGVLPMDAAFKRRWEFEYINIDDGEAELNGVTIPVPNGINEDKTINYVDIEWNTLRKAINEQLKTVSGVNEDKLLGPFFIGDKAKITNAIQDKEQFCKSFKSKVLMYLFEDVVKMQPGELFDSKEGVNVHYSDICKDYDTKGLKIFVNAVSDQFPEFNGEAQ